MRRTRLGDERAFGPVEAPVVCALVIVIAASAIQVLGNREGSVTFTGSAATPTHGSSGECARRISPYDPNAELLPSAWFPPIDDTCTMAFFREVTP